MRPRDIHSGLTAEKLRSVLRYDKDSGQFYWLVSNNQAGVGGEAGWRNPKTGYLLIKVLGHKFMAHRLAWLYVTGEWPVDRIDHQDTNRGNNKWDNLRGADNSKNRANTHVRPDNILGVKGVRLHETGRYHARICERGKFRSLGLHDTAEKAKSAYERAAREIFGEFARSE